jgi:hypothetical protein
MKTKNLFIVLAVLVLLLPGIVLAQDFDQTLGGQSTQSGQGNEITIHDPERATIGTSEDEGQDAQTRVIRFGDDQPVQQAPKWETREGLEEAAKAYFTAKKDYNDAKARKNTAGMRDAAARMDRFSRQIKELKEELKTFKEEQAARDLAQDELIDATANSINALNGQINDPGGIESRLKETETKAGRLEDEMNDIVTPAIAGVDRKFNTIYWWLAFLTVILIIGFGRRYWLNPRPGSN